MIVQRMLGMNGTCLQFLGRLVKVEVKIMPVKINSVVFRNIARMAVQNLHPLFLAVRIWHRFCTYT